MAEPIKFTELSNVGNLSASAIMAVVQQQGGELVSLQCSAAQMAELISNDIEYQNLTTEGKTLVEAINEAAQTGGGGDVSKAYVDAENAKQDEETATIKADLTELDNSVDLLYKLTQGQSWDFVDQTEHGMNVAPKGTQVQSLLSVEGKSEQLTTNGYQLLDFTGQNTNQGIKTEINKNYVKISGTPSSTWAYGTPVLPCSFPAGMYSISITKALTFNIYLNVVFTDDTSKVFMISKGGASLNSDLKDVKSVRLTYSNMTAGTEYNEEFGFMFEAGSTAHDFEPYTGGLPAPNPEYPQEITSVETLNFKVTSRNLFDYTLIPRIDYGQGYYIRHADGGRNGGNQSYRSFDQYIDISNYSGKTITISPQVSGSSTGCAFYDENNTYISGQHNYTGIQVPINAAKIRFCINADVTWDMVKIELGTTATPYEPYREELRTITPPHALNKVGDYADVIDVVKGTYTRRNDVLTFDGTESWNLQSVNSKGFANFAHTLAGVADGETRKSELVNRFTLDDSSIANVVRAGFLHNSANMLYFRISATVASTVTAFRAWLADNPVTMIHALLEPVETPIDTADLDFLKSLQNMEDGNVITITDQNGNDITYLMKYLIKLSEAI